MKVSPRKKLKDIPTTNIFSSSLINNEKLKSSILSMIKKKPALEIDIDSPRHP